MYLDRWKVHARNGRLKDSKELHSDEQSASRLVVELREAHRTKEEKRSKYFKCISPNVPDRLTYT